ncbi:protein psp1 [Anaeramoeba flamelloides]|uniref:Protein psp1 n=1 Tax=Anaeramoeba flamelloides TaxID=1746091 RepID=A0AAV7Y8C1_9EUKA|nr:protein psp1 [Anaeramoeba flamelloides]
MTSKKTEQQKLPQNKEEISITTKNTPKKTNNESKTETKSVGIEINSNKKSQSPKSKNDFLSRSVGVNRSLEFKLIGESENENESKIYNQSQETTTLFASSLKEPSEIKNMMDSLFLYDQNNKNRNFNKKRIEKPKSSQRSGVNINQRKNWNNEQNQVYSYSQDNFEGGSQFLPNSAPDGGNIWLGSYEQNNRQLEYGFGSLNTTPFNNQQPNMSMPLFIYQSGGTNDKSEQIILNNEEQKLQQTMGFNEDFQNQRYDYQYSQYGQYERRGRGRGRGRVRGRGRGRMQINNLNTFNTRNRYYQGDLNNSDENIKKLERGRGRGRGRGRNNLFKTLDDDLFQEDENQEFKETNKNKDKNENENENENKSKNENNVKPNLKENETETENKKEKENEKENEKEVWQVEFKGGRKDIFELETEMEIKPLDFVIVEADRGKDLGRIVKQIYPQDLVNTEENFYTEHKKIYRKATINEVNNLPLKMEEENQALSICQNKISMRGLPMEILDAEFQFDRRKLTFTFLSNARIDFRELVKDLYKIFKVRIWMKHINQTRNN